MSTSSIKSFSALLVMRVGWRGFISFHFGCIILHMIEYREIWKVPAVVVVQVGCPRKQKQSRRSDSTGTIFRGKQYRKGRSEVERLTEGNHLIP